MDRLGGLCSHFSLFEEEEHGAKVSKDPKECTHQLAGRFSTKRVLNVVAVARTTFSNTHCKGSEIMTKDIKGLRLEGDSTANPS
uniref:Uncharacterized protein n=1 Tax=Quercus lobata TaxID=97700 RepID=A0A7N2LCF1_QUELO